LSKRAQTPFNSTNVVFSFNNTEKFECLGLLKALPARDRISKRTPKPVI
jgi:hypothetical protein